MSENNIYKGEIKEKRLKIMIKEKLEKFAEKIHLKRGLIIPLIFTLFFAIIFLVDKVLFHNQLQNIVFSFDLIMLSIFTILIMLMAGFAVIKALFHVAAGLSLIIFLAQSYCAVPNHTVTSDSALKSLVVLGLIYVAFDFFKILHEGWTNYMKTIKSVKWSLEKVLMILLFCTFAGLFLWIIYLVVNPIILDLCIYR